MATKFKKDQEVKVATPVPQGPVEKLRMTEDGEFFYLVCFTDSKGRVQRRWFTEDDLTAV
jgi:hypothetical protein